MIGKITFGNGDSAFSYYVHTTPSIFPPKENQSTIRWKWEPEKGIPDANLKAGFWQPPSTDERIDELVFQVQCLTKEVRRLRKQIKKAMEGEDDNA